MTSTATRHKLAIYVTDACFGCDVARRLAERLKALDVAGLDISIMDIGDPEVERPAAVFAVPTYLLDGAVLSLGNPDEEWLLARLGIPSTSLDNQ
jgi:hypothetical protein